MSAMYLYADDAILFSYLLIHELVAHAKTLALPKRKGFPSPTQADFTELQSSGLLPKIGKAEMQLLRSLRVEPDAALIVSEA
ncbi:hypothetical protein [Caulobacter sp. UC70_42]|uniref:hypothetical protein n=1 Tax=Caulobacter sp. UC70_42 TaxID=3374551 RepID=UPI003757B1CF